MIIPHHDKSRKRKKKNLTKKLSIFNAYINFKLSKVSNSRELKQALEEKDITKEDYDLAYKVAEEIIENIEGKTNELTKFTEECFSFVNQ